MHAFGANGEGQCGLGVTDSSITSPQIVEALDNPGYQDVVRRYRARGCTHRFVISNDFQFTLLISLIVKERITSVFTSYF